MNSKKYSVFITALFSVFIGGLFIAFLLSPKRDFSDTENRVLADAPELSWEAIADGSYMEELETYIADQFPMRDMWIVIKSACEYALGKREFNDVYLSGSTLISKVEQPDQSLVDKNLGYIESFVQSVGKPVYLALIPTAAEIWKDKLPEGAPGFDQEAFLQQVQQSTSAEYVDLLSALQLHKNEAIFYRTDHHWTSLGAYYGYAAFMNAAGRRPLPLSMLTATTVSTEFNGTLYSSSGIRWLPSDSIETYISADGIKVTSYPEGKPVEGTMYDESYLEKKDKYSMFMGGNTPMHVIENPNAQGGSLLVIRDSYMDSELPFLSQEYATITVLDLRYYHGSVRELAAQHDEILISYGVANLITDRNLVYLSR